MKLSTAIKFMQETLEAEGDVSVRVVVGTETRAMTGFWPENDPKTGDRILLCSTGTGNPLARQ